MKALRRLSFLLGLWLLAQPLLHAQNPYERLGIQSDPLTLSQGRYQEFFPNDTLVQIGPVIFNTITQEVVGFAEPDSNGLDFPADVASRWLSPDPLAHMFPEWSPYNYVLNNPLLLIDEDGRIPSYPQNHPVSKVVIAYSPNIWRGFWGANNTSLKHFHQWTRGNAGSDAYGKAIGAIGEGLFADRLTSSVTPLNGIPSNLSFGRSVGGLQTDLLQETQLFSIYDGKFDLKVHHTDLAGNRRESNLNVLGNQRAAVGRIAYEVKTLDPSSDVSLLYKQISRGIEQTIDRANVVDAGVLVVDKAAFDAVMASPLGTQLNEQVQRLQGVTNASGQTKAFLRLEEGLYRDSQRSLHAIKDQISQIE